MQYNQSSESIYESKSTILLKGQLLEQSSTHGYVKRDMVFHGQADENGRRKATASKMIKLDTISILKSNLETPPQRLFTETLSFDNVNLNIRSRVLFSSSLGLHIKGFTIEDPEALSQTDKALKTLHERTRELIEGVFYNIRTIPLTRAPGFVIDGWIVIPEYDGKLERKIYEELGEVIRTNPNLLFSIHIVARKGRNLSEIMPRNYKRYTQWPEYIC